MNYYNNITYLFMPFTFGEPSDFLKLDKHINSAVWEKEFVKQNYLYKYISDKISNSENGLCHHYALKEAAEISYINKSFSYLCGQAIKFNFDMLDMDIFCFNSGVGVFAFKINFETNDPYKISTYQYYLKKVARTVIYPDNDLSKPKTLLEIAQELLPSNNALSFKFFYYSNENTERANLLTYIDTENTEDYDKKLFFLKHSYNSETYSYFCDSDDESKILRITEDLLWGISSEAAVCLAWLTPRNEGFIKKTFFKNFNTQYLFMYVFLLHQKYALYNFITKIDKKSYNNINILKEYKKQLFDFENDYFFSTVTEVPQYQRLYEEISSKFALEKMFANVHEPLQALSELKEQQRDKHFNSALFAISLLAVFSAFTDASSFVDLFSNILPQNIITIAKYGCFALIAVVAGYVIKCILNLRK